jgi:hypothetical protein
MKPSTRPTGPSEATIPWAYSTLVLAPETQTLANRQAAHAATPLDLEYWLEVLVVPLSYEPRRPPEIGDQCVHQGV